MYQSRVSSSNAHLIQRKNASLYLHLRKMPSLFPFQEVSPIRSNPEAFVLKLRLTLECIDMPELPPVCTRANRLCSSAPSTESLSFSGPARFYRAATSVRCVAHHTMRGKYWCAKLSE
jgi:hypothetical protein